MISRDYTDISGSPVFYRTGTHSCVSPMLHATKECEVAHIGVARFFDSVCAVSYRYLCD